MRAVGWIGEPTWEDGALDLVHRYSGGIPRRINRLCSRVLLGGALEQSPVLTAPMVEATALELEEDLGGGGGSSPAPVALRRPNIGAAMSGAMIDRLEEAIEELTQRLDALERQVNRRERTFNRMMDLLTEIGHAGSGR